MVGVLKWFVCFVEGHELTKREENNIQKYKKISRFNGKPLEYVSYNFRKMCDCGRHKTEWEHVDQPRKHANK